MAWVHFPDGSRRKVEHIVKAEAQADLDVLLNLRARGQGPTPVGVKGTTFAEVIQAWFDDDCPNVAPTRKSRHARPKSPNTIANARQLLGTSVIPAIGKLRVDQTTTQRLEELFQSMAARGYATSTIDRDWNYLDQALWPCVDLDSDDPSIEIAERALEVDDKYVGQAMPKTTRSKRTIGLHPLLIAALERHKEEQDLLGLYEPEGFVFCTRNGTPMTMSNIRRALRTLCQRAGLGDDWTTYELRHSFVSLVSDQLDDLIKVADLAGHVDTRTTERPNDRTTEGDRHSVRQSLPHAIGAWDSLLESASPK